jgi:hypothetical protein
MKTTRKKILCDSVLKALIMINRDNSETVIASVIKINTTGNCNEDIIKKNT